MLKLASKGKKTLLKNEYNYPEHLKLDLSVKQKVGWIFFATMVVWFFIAYICYRASGGNQRERDLRRSKMYPDDFTGFVHNIRSIHSPAGRANVFATVPLDS